MTCGKTPFEAVLVLGPTGAGKTPLGAFCEKHGLWGRECAHFDFGHELRRAADGGDGVDLTGPDIRFIRRMLHGGALLEEDRFYIAGALFSRFVLERHVGAGHMLVLNGLPRHEAQAERMAEFVDVKALINLVCEPETVAGRIRFNTGGDRTGRVDDAYDRIAAKLRLFTERTLPLVRYYCSRNVPVLDFSVGLHTLPEEIHESLNSCHRRGL